MSKPWAKAGIHLLVLYALFGAFVAYRASNLDEAMATGRERMTEAGMAPYLDGVEENVATDGVTEIGPLDYDITLELREDWMVGSYGVDDRRMLCLAFQTNPQAMWQNVGHLYEDTPENRATVDAVYTDLCTRSFPNGGRRLEDQ